MKIELSALEMRVAQFIGENYPVTVDDIRKGLSMRRETLSRVLKALAAKGVVELEPLPDKTYVSLLAPVIAPPGASAKKQPSQDDDDGSSESYMYT